MNLLEKLNDQIQKIQANELNIVCFSQASNDGFGGWETGYPEAMDTNDLEKWFSDNRYNSLVECHQFKTIEDALFHYNDMKK